MQRNMCLLLFALVVGFSPALSQERNRRSPPASNEIQIPSDQMLERDAVTIPRNNFSTNDAKAIKQMDRRAKQIDRKVMNGICDGC